MTCGEASPSPSAVQAAGSQPALLLWETLSACVAAAGAVSLPVGWQLLGVQWVVLPVSCLVDCN